MLPFLGITAYWIGNDWELKEMLLDFCKLARPYSGENIAEVFERCCRELGILTKVCIIWFFCILALKF